MPSDAGSQSWMRPEGVAGLISVITPTYNRATFIATTLDSVLAQTYRPIEIIVVDDGSSDNTGPVIMEWKRKADAGLAVRYFRQENQGGCAARNRGLRESRGEFINFLDSDDRLLPDALQRKVDCLRSSPAPYCYDLGERVDGDGKLVGHHGRPWSAYGGKFFLVYHFDITGPLVRRGLCQKIGPWDESLRGCQEEEYFARLKLHGGRGTFLDQIGHVVVEHEENRVVGSKGHRRAFLPAREKMLQSIQLAGPAYAQEAEFLTALLRLNYAQNATQAWREGDCNRAVANLQKARDYGYSSWHVTWFLTATRLVGAKLFAPLYFSLRERLHNMRGRLANKPEPDPVREMYAIIGK
jgi:glycosyltransferase involved in cell wall biosynthesis